IPPAIVLKNEPLLFCKSQAFRTFHGNYLRSHCEGFVNTADVIKDNENWTILPLNKTYGD
ncbi:1655_t:CDS:2, partial [Acaulospora morrowiae]